MTRLLHGLGRACARHRILVVLIWVAAAVVLGVGAHHVGQQTSDNLSLPGTDSELATQVLGQRFPAQANGTNPITLRAPHGAKLSATKYKNAINQVVSAYGKDRAIRAALGPFSSAGGGQLSKNGNLGFISLTLKDSPSQLSVAEAQRIIAVAAPARAAGLQVAAGGYLGQKVSKPSARLSEIVGITAAIVILLITFGTAAGMAMPIITALFGLIGGLSVIALISRMVEVPTTAPALATMIGLGVGIDYGLFVVTRHLEQLSDGVEMRESIARSIATSGGAVLFAGGTVIIALLSLAFADIPLVTTLGCTAAIVVLVAMSASLTLLPALLSLLGPRIHRLRLPTRRPRQAASSRGAWHRWAELVAGHPVRAILGALAILLVLAVPLRLLHLGQTDVGALPTDTQARQAYDAMSSGFGPGSNGPMLVAVSLSKKATNDQKQLNSVKQQQITQQKRQQHATQQVSAQDKQQQSKDASQQAQIQQQEKFLASTASDPRLQTLRTDIQKTSGVKSVTEPLVNKTGTAAVYTVIADYAPSDTRTETVVNTLRDTTIPNATDGQGMRAHVGGTTAGYIDLAHQISSKLPLVITIVLALSFVLLTLAFRSLLVPLKAVVMNLLSIGAAFGVVTYAFGHHWSAALVGLDGAVPIVSFVPLMMFAILFGLSMDYEVFLMSNVREQWKQTGNPHQAVINGLGETARVITSAALIMVTVFCAFVINGDPNIKQFGLGMAAAVAIDATIVRCLLVPATMSILDRAAWWLPRWLDRRLPHVSIEGDEFFARRDTQPSINHAPTPAKTTDHHAELEAVQK